MFRVNSSSSGFKVEHITVFPWVARRSARQCAHSMHNFHELHQPPAGAFRAYKFPWAISRSTRFSGDRSATGSFSLPFSGLKLLQAFGLVQPGPTFSFRQR